MCDDPHMKGIRGQRINWSGIDGAWYSLLKNDEAHLNVNVRLTAPLPEEFPERQFITGLSVLSNGHSLVIEVKNPYAVDTNVCPHGVSPCLANGGLRAVVDGEEVDDILAFSRNRHVVQGITLSASNVPAECRPFGRDKIMARMHDETLQDTRRLNPDQQFEDWILRFGEMAAPGLYSQYIQEHELADLQSTHAVFKIATPAVTVRLNVGTNSQGGGDLDGDGRILPDLEFWQMKVGLHGLSVEHESLSGMLGETARPVLDDDGREVMQGYGAFRGTVQDYRGSGPWGVDFALLHKR